MHFILKLDKGVENFRMIAFNKLIKLILLKIKKISINVKIHSC